MIVALAAGPAVAQEPVRPTPPPIAAPPDARDWTHLRIGFSPNFSTDPSDYDGPRSAYFITSWTAGGTVLHTRFYLDPLVPREVDGRDVNASYTLRETVKEIFVRRTLANGFQVTAGDIRATAHSDNNKVLYAADGKPVHSSIVEIDRVLGASVAKTWPWMKLEATLADRGRKDLHWNGLMEAVRVSRSSTHGFSDIQATFVNRTGRDAGGVAAPHQWQWGVGGTYSTSGRLNSLSGEYVHGNFLPGRTLSSDAFSAAYERRLQNAGGVSLVADYEHINGASGVNFYEAGVGVNLMPIGKYAYLRTECGWRRKDPTAATERSYDGAFVRLGLVFDHGNGAVKRPAMVDDALPPKR